MVGFTPKGQGKYAAIGDMGGTITLLELCPSLYEQNMHLNEKDVISEIFDREKKKEEKLRVMRMQKEKRIKLQKTQEEKLEKQRQGEDE